MEKIGDTYASISDWHSAYTTYEESYTTKVNAANYDTSSTEYKRQIAKSLIKKGEALLRLEDFDNANTILSLVRRQLLELYDNAPLPEALLDLALTDSLLSETLDKMKNDREAVDSLEHSSKEAADLYKVLPNCENFSRALSLRNNLFIALLTKGFDPSTARATFERRIAPFECEANSELGRAARTENRMALLISDVFSAVYTASAKIDYFRPLNPMLNSVAEQSLRDESFDSVRIEEILTKLSIHFAKNATKLGLYNDAFLIMLQNRNLIGQNDSTQNDRARVRVLGYGQLSWNALLVGNVDLAEESAERALTIIKKHELQLMSFVELNLAHALMFGDKYTEAKIFTVSSH